MTTKTTTLSAGRLATRLTVLEEHLRDPTTPTLGTLKIARQVDDGTLEPHDALGLIVEVSGNDLRAFLNLTPDRIIRKIIGNVTFELAQAAHRIANVTDTAPQDIRNVKVADAVHGLIDALRAYQQAQDEGPP